MTDSQRSSQAENSKNKDRKTPYPFDVNVEGGDRSYEAKALKLVMHGLMLEVEDGVLGVGEKALVKFDLPADIGYVESSISVIKTYDRKIPSKSGTVTQRIVEVHFSAPLKDSMKTQVKRFLKEAKQFGVDLA